MESERRRFLATSAAVGISTLAAGPVRGDDKAKDDKKVE
jgi:hypothetical protein